MKEKKLHIFWILIDSARNFPTDEDDRGLPKSVRSIAKQSLFFKNVVCSAPSTLMSVSSMMTSTPSYLLSRNYNNFPGITDTFDTFPDLLKDNGYNIFGTIYFKHGREALSGLFGNLGKKFLPKYLKHRKEVWTNKDVYNVFENIINKNDWQKPTFCYLHYNVRIDKNISLIIDNTLGLIKKKNLDEKSILIINSDHGYPMPNRGFDAIAARKAGWGHDLMLYNDNILTPLVLKIPGLKSNLDSKFYSSLDIVPTLCNQINIQSSPKFMGKDLFRIDHNKNRFIRVDNRYIGQIPSGTAIINNGKKLIIEIDPKGQIHFEYYNILSDPLESKNLANGSHNIELQEMKKEYEILEAEFQEFHESFLVDKWSHFTKKFNVDGSQVGLLTSSVPRFERLLSKVFQKILPKVDLHLFRLEEEVSKAQLDSLFVIIESEIPWDSKQLLNRAKKYNAKKFIYTDNNGEMYFRIPMLNLYKKYFKNRLMMFKQDKLFVFEFAKRIFLKKILGPIRE